MDCTGFINNGIDSLKHLWYERIVILCGSYNDNSSLKFDIKAKQFYAASQRVL